jgi:signal transduction histidine kinase
LGEVAAGVAHELFNPLAAIRGRMELLQMQADRELLDREKVSQAAQTAIALLDRMTQIIRAMRQLGRDAGQDPFRPVSVAALVAEAVEFVAMRFKRSGVEVEIDPLPEGLVVVCRETQILQVLLNLVQNAFDAVVGRAGGAIRLRVECGEDRVRFLVLDSGPGVPEGLLDRIFNPFFTTKEQGKGTGLGLSLSHSIALQHAGTLRYEPQDGRSCFVLNLPKVQVADPSPFGPLPPAVPLS